MYSLHQIKAKCGSARSLKVKILIHCAQLFYLENTENSTSPLGEKKGGTIPGGRSPVQKYVQMNKALICQLHFFNA